MVKWTTSHFETDIDHVNCHYMGPYADIGIDFISPVYHEQLNYVLLSAFFVLKAVMYFSA